MKTFRRLSRHYPVTIAYPNPVSNGRQAVTFNLDLCQNSQEWIFRRKETYELDWLKLIGLGMNSADSFIDVGAHVGVYALPIAQAFPGKRVVAFEPLPSNYSRLEDNVRANCLTNIEMHEAAVAETDGSISVYVNPINDGGASTIETKVYRTGDVRIDASKYQEQHPAFMPVIAAKAMRLDDVINDVTVLKIDVEGAELSVLKSGANAFNDGKVDLMVVEVTRQSIGEVREILAAAGFDCFYYGDHSLISDLALLPRGMDNILCLRRKSPAYDSILSNVTHAIP